MKQNNKNSSQFFNILLITLFCVLLSFLLVWPLWKFATVASSIYTILCLILIASGCLYLIIRKIKKTPLKKNIKIILFFLILIAGLSFSIYFLIFGKRFIALVVLFIAIGLLISLNLFLNKIFK